MSVFRIQSVRRKEYTVQYLFWGTDMKKAFILLEQMLYISEQCFNTKKLSKSP
ncbi:hypothetical protein SAMN04488028_10268 [Reichenbachiella agariperforans]|uniref:Uncharacterized protein n=1 Tax=Reichenbachiella agariperforans TaxID=156994 RepID=A0A1M6N2E0_REIAG|nr:hypothetical protein SAMN04488028_10268 [Reichenbachiella agariperforans]